ncbi:MAG: YraN family protein [Bacteroidota bacterium]|nr:YraN family protein [Bacteroidota bacterium]
MTTSRTNSATKKNFGAIGEQAAEKFLIGKGYQILERNYFYQHGEIDIIAKDQETFVFVEVKTRRSAHFGKPEESVTPKKQELLRRTAEGYVLQKNLPNIDCRFDVVSIVLDGDKAQFNLFKNCF